MPFVETSGMQGLGVSQSRCAIAAVFTLSRPHTISLLTPKAQLCMFERLRSKTEPIAASTVMLSHFFYTGAVMSKADDLRQQAKDAGRRADQAKSLQISTTERTRQKGLEQLAENEDWLDGKTTANLATDPPSKRPDTRR